MFICLIYPVRECPTKSVSEVERVQLYIYPLDKHKTNHRENRSFPPIIKTNSSMKKKKKKSVISYQYTDTTLSVPLNTAGVAGKQ